jgi:acetyltransferase-like isoleucine patch superfamily enzyme
MKHDSSNYEKYFPADSIRMDQDCWRGQGGTVLASVHLGPHTVVGAGAVVTKSFPSGNQLIEGNPAYFIKHLPPYEKGNLTGREGLLWH